jgi:tRNA(Ile)-lysidine synthase TilS/MesJ
MSNLMLLTELGRLRQHAIAREVALCHHARSPRIAVGRTLVALGALVVLLGSTLDDEAERKPEITVA